MSEFLSNPWSVLITFGAASFLILLVVLLVPSGREKDPHLQPGELHIAITHPHATALSEWVSWAQLPTGDREVFFPVPPHANPVYQVTLAGVIYGHSDVFDAFYMADGNGNFLKKCACIRVNGEPLWDMKYDMVAADRFAHSYTIQFRQSGNKRLTLSFTNFSWGSRGALTALVTLLPRESLTKIEVLEAETTAMQQERARQALDLAARKKSTEAAERFASQIQALCIRAELIPNLGNAEYLKKFAHAYANDLLEAQSEIRKEATQLLEQREILAFLQRHHPQVVDRFFGRLHALHMAEQVVLDKRLAAIAAPKKEKPKPKRRLSADEVRELKIRRQRLQLGDKLALAKDKAATIEDTKAYVKAQYGHLDEDEQQQIVQQLLDQIREEDHNNGKTL